MHETSPGMEQLTIQHFISKSEALVGKRYDKIQIEVTFCLVQHGFGSCMRTSRDDIRERHPDWSRHSMILYATSESLNVPCPTVRGGGELGAPQYASPSPRRLVTQRIIAKLKSNP